MLADGYSPDWIGPAGLDLDPGYCLTFIKGLSPYESLARIGRAGVSWPTWNDLREAGSSPVAALSLGADTVLVEENGYRLRHWTEPLSAGTTAVNVRLAPESGAESLLIVQNGTRLARIDGDADGEIETFDQHLEALLIDLARDAGDAVEDADLLRLACDYLFVRPTVPDVTGPILGTLISND